MLLKQILKMGVTFAGLCGLLVLAQASAGAPSDNADKVTVCHVSVEAVDDGTYLVQFVEISISSRAVPAHLAEHAYDIGGDEGIDVQDEIGPCLDPM